MTRFNASFMCPNSDSGTQTRCLDRTRDGNPSLNDWRHSVAVRHEHVVSNTDGCFVWVLGLKVTWRHPETRSPGATSRHSPHGISGVRFRRITSCCHIQSLNLYKNAEQSSSESKIVKFLVISLEATTHCRVDFDVFCGHFRSGWLTCIAILLTELCSFKERFRKKREIRRRALSKLSNETSAGRQKSKLE